MGSNPSLGISISTSTTCKRLPTCPWPGASGWPSPHVAGKLHKEKFVAQKRGPTGVCVQPVDRCPNQAAAGQRHCGVRVGPCWRAGHILLWPLAWAYSGLVDICPLCQPTGHVPMCMDWLGVWPQQDADKKQLQLWLETTEIAQISPKFGICLAPQGLRMRVWETIVPQGETKLTKRMEPVPPPMQGSSGGQASLKKGTLGSRTRGAQCRCRASISEHWDRPSWSGIDPPRLFSATVR